MSRAVKILSTASREEGKNLNNNKKSAYHVRAQKPVLNLCIEDALGLAMHPEVIKQMGFQIK